MKTIAAFAPIVSLFCSLRRTLPLHHARNQSLHASRSLNVTTTGNTTGAADSLVDSLVQLVNATIPLLDDLFGASGNASGNAASKRGVGQDVQDALDGILDVILGGNMKRDSAGGDIMQILDGLFSPLKRSAEPDSSSLSARGRIPGLQARCQPSAPEARSVPWKPILKLLPYDMEGGEWVYNEVEGSGSDGDSSARERFADDSTLFHPVSYIPVSPATHEPLWVNDTGALKRSDISYLSPSLQNIIQQLGPIEAKLSIPSEVVEDLWDLWNEYQSSQSSSSGSSKRSIYYDIIAIVPPEYQDMPEGSGFVNLKRSIYSEVLEGLWDAWNTYELSTSSASSTDVYYVGDILYRLYDLYNTEESGSSGSKFKCTVIEPMTIGSERPLGGHVERDLGSELEFNGTHTLCLPSS
ncbi:hypothetical protein CONPUDRAFT_73186 [Coniophora puteana RWD-64-598 SS2]|uniref:Uncharacterized protein n=1 Tax=Coniophora puteana (strain RWD-64-598) TaxID=741705 RepID=A0A5M3MQV7_CONPW|nr:uncharacterized protein CONPUDRAFT_73186 [Coniophora puteana RWD-64-598 SS2]EIW81460.1 hypothetical protein CONPUDRAFT_73186 [Coniophora puteana RWD-64-598 SS2]